MQNGSHSYIWPVLVTGLAVLCIGTGAYRLATGGGEAAGRQSACAEQQRDRNARRADWGWNVFNNGGGSPIYRL